MKVYKEGKYLICNLDDRSTVKFDFSTCEFIGKKGKAVVGLNSQLRNMPIANFIEMVENENYRNFLRFVKKRTSCRIRNVGSFLKEVSKYIGLEQYFSSGVQVDGWMKRVQFKDVPEGLWKTCRDKNIVLTFELFSAYIENPIINFCILNLDFNIFNASIFVAQNYKRNATKGGNVLNTLINIYNYEYKSLLKYLDNLMMFEGIDNQNHLFSEFYDYVEMAHKLNPKFEKYPKNFLTTHRITTRNYNMMKKEFDEENFKKRIDKSLEWAYNGFMVIYPKSTDEIKDEANQQQHCVSQYIDKVINGKCDIVFLRRKEDVKNSLITLEIRDNQVVQARGRFNRIPDTEEQRMIDLYNKKLSKRNEELKDVG